MAQARVDAMQVSIHTLAWRVTSAWCQRLSLTVVSIHTLAWRVTSLRRFISSRNRFNPHPRVEGDEDFGGKFKIHKVSIHTLAWRVTYLVVVAVRKS